MRVEERRAGQSQAGKFCGQSDCPTRVVVYMYMWESCSAIDGMHHQASYMHNYVLVCQYGACYAARVPDVFSPLLSRTAGCVTLYQANFGRVCCDLESPIQHLYAKIYALYYNCVQTSRTMHLYPAYKLINLRIFNTTGLFFRLKRLKRKDSFSYVTAPAHGQQLRPPMTNRCNSGL